MVLDGHLPSDIREFLTAEGASPDIAIASYQEAVRQAAALPALSEVERLRLRVSQLDRLACKASAAMDYSTARACLVEAQKLDEKAYLLDPCPMTPTEPPLPPPADPFDGWTS
jgi:hypothetical protein